MKSLKFHPIWLRGVLKCRSLPKLKPPKQGLDHSCLNIRAEIFCWSNFNYRRWNPKSFSFFGAVICSNTTFTPLDTATSKKKGTRSHLFYHSWSNLQMQLFQLTYERDGILKTLNFLLPCLVLQCIASNSTTWVGYCWCHMSSCIFVFAPEIILCVISPISSRLLRRMSFWFTYAY